MFYYNNSNMSLTIYLYIFISFFIVELSMYLSKNRSGQRCLQKHLHKLVHLPYHFLKTSLQFYSHWNELPGFLEYDEQIKEKGR